MDAENNLRQKFISLNKALSRKMMSLFVKLQYYAEAQEDENDAQEYCENFEAWESRLEAFEAIEESQDELDIVSHLESVLADLA